MRQYQDRHYSPSQRESTDLVPYAMGCQACDPGYRYGPIYRSYPVIHFVESGRGRLEVHGKSLEVHAGEAFLIPAQELAAYEADADDPWSYCWVSFMGLGSSRHMQTLLNSARGGHILEGLDCAKYRGLVERVLAGCGGELSSHLHAMAVLYEVLAQLYRDLEVEEVSWAGPDLVGDVRRHIDTNIGKPLRVDEIARTFNVHPSYLSRRFSQEYGVSPKRYILERRLQKARMLVETTDEPIGLIGASLGFPDPQAFSRAFRRHVGCSAQELRSRRTGA